MNDQPILESQGFRIFAGYVVCYAVGLIAAVVFAMSNEPFALNAESVIRSQLAGAAIASLIILPVAGALVIAAIVAATCLGIGILASI